ncbi:MAG: mutator protein MutT [Arenicella sp.]|jgi:mutator protein MutT
MLRDLIENNLSLVTRSPIKDKTLTRAAVVLAVMYKPGEVESPCFLLTRRASKMRKHAGQFALPGGKVDAGETVEEAALRELEEELGISVDSKDILGVLDDYPTRSGFCITPVVVWLGEDITITPSPDEVAKVFHIPLEELYSDGLVNLEPGEAPDRPVLSINLNTIGHQVYAPTAAIIYQFYEAAIKGNDTRVAFYDEPIFAWK